MVLGALLLLYGLFVLRTEDLTDCLYGLLRTTNYTNYSNFFPKTTD